MEMNLQEKLIDVIITIMKKQDITKAELSRRININQVTLRKYLLHKRDMPVEIALLISKELQIDLNRLIGIRMDDLTEDDYELLATFNELLKVIEKKEKKIKAIFYSDNE